MKNKAIIGIIAGVIFCILAGLGFFFLGVRKPPEEPAQPGLPGQIKNIKRKLAWTSDPDRNLRKAETAEARGDWKGALYYYNYLAKTLPMEDPRKGYASYKEALCYYNLGDYVRARRSLEFALNLFPDMPQIDRALFLMAQIYTKFGDFTLADKTYNTIIRMFPSAAQEAKEKQQQLPQQSREQKQEQKAVPQKIVR